MVVYEQRQPVSWSLRSDGIGADRRTLESYLRDMVNVKAGRGYYERVQRFNKQFRKIQREKGDGEWRRMDGEVR